MKKQVWFMFIVCFVWLLPSDAVTIIEQDFEDSVMFVVGQSLGGDGKGDGSGPAGLWFNPEMPEATSPMTSGVNSGFSYGDQCLHLQRDEIYGSGFLRGLRTNTEISGSFQAEFAFKMAGQVPSDPTVQFVAYLVDGAGGSGIQVGVAYLGDGKFYTMDEGLWKAKTSMVGADQWHRLKIIGSLVTGTYNVYIDFGAGNNWKGWQLLAEQQHFETSELSGIAGINVTPWTQDDHIYIDDINLSGDVDTPMSCPELLEMQMGLTSDFNDDCHVDLLDFAELMQQWLACVDPVTAHCELF